jgi:glutathione synthase/RimK-type ligase-like ATP-grasp enzyme
LNKKGYKTFPNTNTGWHYDDKLGQKYLLEAINAPIVPSYIFYTRDEALNWIKTTTFPKVFKLRGGAGSVNVKLVRNKKQAFQLVKRSFSKGFKRFDRMAYVKDQLRNYQKDKSIENLKRIFVALGRFIFPNIHEKMSSREKGYIYFQDFLPGNDFDTRLVVIGNRCFGIRRYNRKNDFRASGSGIIDPDPTLIRQECIKIAFEVANKLNAQCLAFDFLFDDDKPRILEISYTFTTYNNYFCPGYWDKTLKWHEEPVNPQYYIIEDFIATL